MADERAPQPYGVTADGFTAKPLGAILEDAFARARDAFGADVDLRPSSPLRKILELVAAEDTLLWMKLEDAYYANFIATAIGRQLDGLGDDLGLERRFERAHGSVQFTVAGDLREGCTYVIPLGTVVQTAARVQFRTTERLALSRQAPAGEAAAVALRRGPAGNARPGEIVEVNPEYARRFLSFPPGGAVTVSVQSTAPFTDGDLLEDDLQFRRRLIDRPRTLWTAESVRQAALDVDGVRDSLVWDPYGGLDRTSDWFGSFRFKERMLSTERDLCSPYFFDLVVAPEPGAVWEGSSDLPGVRDDVEAALRDRRPISVFPNILRALEVEIAVHAVLVTSAGADQNALLGEARRRLDAYITHLELGQDVLASEVLCALLGVPGVLDVRDLRLFRCPPRFGLVVFCKELEFQDAPIEATCGENIVIDAREVAVLAPPSDLARLEAVPR
jgi:uncharacterized phage protein gp47/JayE